MSRERVIRTLLSGWALAVAALVAASASADDEGAAWRPSLGLSFGGYSQSISGTTNSNVNTLPPSTGDSYISEIIQFEGKLLTPLGFEDWPLQPRLFFSGGFQIPLAEGLIAARLDQSFDRVEVEEDFLVNCPENIPGGVAQTCSLRIRNKVTIEAFWYAGIGLDLTLPIAEGRFHVLPAVEYYGLAVEGIGEFQRTSAAGPGVNDLVENSDVVGDAVIYHGISPSLTLLTDLYEDGPWLWSMFIQARVVFFLNEPTIGSESSFGANQLVFVAEIDEYAPQGTIGFQVQWTGR